MINTRNKYHRHRLPADFSGFQESECFTGIKVFNSVPCNTMQVHKFEGW